VTTEDAVRPPSAPVAVVIPTIGRPGLLATIASVAEQTVPVAELVVIADGPLPPGMHDAIERAFERHRFPRALLLQNESSGASAARNLGLDASTAAYVAFLDDDDWLLPEKVATQLPVLQASDETGTIVAGQALYRRGEATPSVVPASPYRGDQSLAEYLFARRRISLGRNLIPTPTWLMTRAHAVEVGWNDALVRHQDWDFLLRSEQLGGTVVQLQIPVAVVWQESVRSITSTPAAAPSYEWARTWRDSWSEEVFREFVWSQPLRYALQAHDWAMARTIVRESDRPLPPSWSAMVMAGSGLVGRRRSLGLLDALDSLRRVRS
jgi:glycosyltransferase involved in cell wall biosynthesis